MTCPTKCPQKRIYTTSFWYPTDLPRYSIALSQPKGMHLPEIPEVMPPVRLFHDLKNGTCTWDYYCNSYEAELDFECHTIISVMEELTNESVLCCWEKNPEKCHRSILARWLTKHGIQCEEL